MGHFENRWIHCSSPGQQGTVDPMVFKNHKRESINKETSH